MAKKLKIGIIGMSDGNGHPYSWSAIFNGYDKSKMKDCPFPVITEYLSKQSFPEDGLGELACVTHIWTQDKTISNHIAAAAKIEFVVSEKEEMIGQVDVILLARDDAENHYDMALPFIRAGIPIFIDKPLALSVKVAKQILTEQKYDNQVFSCSSLRYAKEFDLTENDKATLGDIIHVEASIAKSWEKYSVHIIEPVIARIPMRGELKSVCPISKKEIISCLVEWENVTAYFKVTGNISVPVKIRFYGEKGVITKEFKNSYDCFKNSLNKFIDVALNQEDNISRKETLEIIEIIEKGNK
jgi:hypothetical protein